MRYTFGLGAGGGGRGGQLNGKESLKHRCKKKSSFPLLRKFHFPVYVIISDGKCTRVENDGKLNQNRRSFAGYLKNPYCMSAYHQTMVQHVTRHVGVPAAV